jgi:ActR/RegA family two-component response regulator
MRGPSLTDRPESPWILVVDDAAGMRALMRRALTAQGYAVDAAPTLADARTMRPVRYDGVVVDAHLGDGRGTDLVHEMILEDPAAAARCLVITGGGAGALPDGVSLLAKPFSSGELVAAVRALHASRTPAVPPARSRDRATSAATAAAAATPPAERAAPAERATPAPVAALATVTPVVTPSATVSLATTPGPAASWPVPEPRPTAGGLPARPWLEIIRRLRTREREALVDDLHDGPVQELAAVTLALHLLRRSVPPDVAEHVDELKESLDKASRMLRSLIDGGWPFLREETQLTEALTERTAWLLATPLAVTLRREARLRPAEVPGVADLAELMLFALADGQRPARAEAVIGVDGDRISIELIVTPPAGDEPPPGREASAASAVADLAFALGAEIQAEVCPQRGRAAVTVPR